MHLLIVALTLSVIRTDSEKSSPPWTTRCPMPSISLFWRMTPCWALEEVQDHFDGHAVVEDLADLPDPGPAFRLVGDDGVARPDLLHDALGQEAFVVHAHELELDGRAAAVENEDFHALSISSGRG